jgi:hypothetical protein
LDCGAVEAVVVDARDEFAEDFCPSRVTCQLRSTWIAIPGKRTVSAAHRAASR